MNNKAYLIKKYKQKIKEIEKKVSNLEYEKTIAKYDIIDLELDLEKEE